MNGGVDTDCQLTNNYLVSCRELGSVWSSLFRVSNSGNKLRTGFI